MAMLAEPRRRKRYNLCPRGKALYEDDNRFGTKMLEKMGWSKGHGLGANLDGQQEFVRVRFKNDAEGLGFEARDDQWTTHEEGFNGLLKALNGEASEEEKAAAASASEEDESRPAFGFGFKANEATPAPAPQKKQLKEKISGVSLEERSKESKARVHYKKFTRGKDLSQYSEKDLANIFGKKATDDIEEPIKEPTPPPPEKKDTDPNFAGVQTVSTGLSVQDYFKQKMEAMKNRTKNNSDNTSPINGKEEQKEEDIVEEPLEDLPKKKKKKKNKERELAEEIEINEEALPKKKKKSKKSKEEKEDTKENVQELDDETTVTKKKKKKENIEKDEEIIPEESTKRKQKKRDKSEIEDVKIVDETPSEESSKKRKRSKPEIEVQELEEDTKSPPAAEDDKQNQEPPLKKRKKSKKTKDELVEEELLTKDEEIPEIKKTKKKKTKDSNEDTLSVAEDCPTEETEVKSKKKKKKSKNEDKTNGDILPTDSVSAAISSGDISDSSSTEPEVDDYLAKQKLQEELKSFDIIKISSFCAEQFQLLNMSAFTNATLHQIPGYGCSDNLQLEVEDNEFDRERLINLWNNTSSTLYKKTKRAYPNMVNSTTVRAVKKRTVFAAV